MYLAVGLTWHAHPSLPRVTPVATLIVFDVPSPCQQVASHSDPGFLASTAAATTGELVANAADKLADALNLKSPPAAATSTTTASSDSTSGPHLLHQDDVYQHKPHIALHTGGAGAQSSAGPAAAPAGPPAEVSGAQPQAVVVSEGLKELVARNTIQQPTRITVRPTTPIG